MIPFDASEGQDVTRWEDCEKIAPVDIVFHLAAVVFVPSSQHSPRETYHTNVTGTLNMLEFARIRRAKMIFASSYVYGKPHYLPIDEKHPLQPTNPYARSKVLCELLCRAYNEDHAVSCIVLRPFNIYGRGQDRRFLIPEILEQLQSKKEVVLKDLAPRRDFLYIDDAIDAYVKAAQFEGSRYEIFNVGSGRSYTVREIAERMAGLYGVDAPVRSLEKPREGEIPDTVADISKAEKLLGWRPKVDIDTGLRAVVGP